MPAAVIDLRLERFARTLRRLSEGRLGVQFVPEFEPEAIAYWRELPDRILAGAAAFAACERAGFAVLGPGDMLAATCRGRS